ncbi:MAG: Na/Pi cotransporter family protein, partial [Clostridia bacterium]|nr:Na/Pi cotransporter family protein [Clostridia bacterium]
NNPLKAFLLGILVTAIIQSSTATIVITSGLVAAGVIKLDQSLGIIIGANVGTTVTGQIIRLLDLNEATGNILRFFRPSTLAPVALVVGIVLLMGFKFKKSRTVGNIAIGFGILFSGLLNMTEAVASLSETGVFESLFASLGDNPVLAYLAGAGIAFVLQSSSATVGILQAFAMVNPIPFSTLFVIVVGIYLGDCLTTAIVCSIGAKSDARRVGIVNILFNLSETVLVLLVVNILHATGLIDSLWNMTLSSGGIANTNTIFNLSCAILLLPAVKLYAKASRVLIKDDKLPVEKYASVLDGLNPVFFNTPALAFKASYDALGTMFRAASDNLAKAIGLTSRFDEKTFAEVRDEEDRIDQLADRISTYLASLSRHIQSSEHMRILEEYHKLTSEFEHLGDHALTIAESAQFLQSTGHSFSPLAVSEIEVLRKLLDRILEETSLAFEKRDLVAARRIEPLEEVMDDLINALHDNHIARLRSGKCTVDSGTAFLDILSAIERVSDTCSNVGVAIVIRVQPEISGQSHQYISRLHQGVSTDFNDDYTRAHDE